jgi:hypothetical protein
MMATPQRATASGPRPDHGHGGFNWSRGSDPRSAHGTTANRRLSSLADRVRTFVDRTLDAVLGRFDH